MLEAVRPVPKLNDILIKGEILPEDFYLLDPEKIAGLSEPELYVIASAISSVTRARYGEVYSDVTTYEPKDLVKLIATRNIAEAPTTSRYYFWLVGKDDTAGFVTAISYTPPNGSKLGRSVKSPESQFETLRGGTIMKRRIPFLLEKLPYIDWYSVDSRAARVETIASSAKSPFLVPCGLEPKHSIYVPDRGVVQDPTVVMIGFRNPETLPTTQLYAPGQSLSLQFLQNITALMNARWQREIYVISEPLIKDTDPSEISPGDYTVRLGNYASIKILNQKRNSKQIDGFIEDFENKFFDDGSRYLTFELDPSEPASVHWQTALQNRKYYPTRFMPPISQDVSPTLRFGRLNPEVRVVFGLNLQEVRVDTSFPNSAELLVVFQNLVQIGELLLAEKNLIPEVF